MILIGGPPKDTLLLGNAQMYRSSDKVIATLPDLGLRSLLQDTKLGARVKGLGFHRGVIETYRV